MRYMMIIPMLCCAVVVLQISLALGTGLKTTFERPRLQSAVGMPLNCLHIVSFIC